MVSIYKWKCPFLNRNPTSYLAHLGCMELIDHYGIDVEGLNVCVIGCSSVVGLPLTILLQQRNATVTMCHIYTRDLKEHTLRADMIFSCCGVPKIVKEDMIKEGVIIIDIGINIVENRIVGDVDFEGVKDKCSYIARFWRSRTYDNYDVNETNNQVSRKKDYNIYVRLL